MDLKQIQQIILDLGADRVGVVAVEDIEFEPSFHKLCESNSCGMYGKSWMCPPLIGRAEDLICQAKQYRLALVYQTVDRLEDSFDFEGMMAAGDRMNRLCGALGRRLRELGTGPFLLLGAGGCRVCQRCARLENKPCRKPEEAISSLEAYGVNVSALAPLAGMKYTNGANTATYFGAVFLREGT